MEKIIAPPIRELIGALEALSFPIVAFSSGSGPADPRDLLPWIDISPSCSNPVFQELQEQEHELVHRAWKAHQDVVQLRSACAMHPEYKPSLEHKEAEANALYQHLHTVQKSLRIAQAEPRQRLVGLLACFYNERWVPFDQRLILSPTGARTRLQSQGGAADLFLISPGEIQLQKLSDYREEMRCFATFLQLQHQELA